MTAPEHIALVAALFVVFCVCVYQSLNPDRSRWWLVFGITFLILAAAAAAWGGWDTISSAN